MALIRHGIEYTNGHKNHRTIYPTLRGSFTFLSTVLLASVEGG
ncbi:hypothetical protein AB1J28_06800 [Lysinibacillus irui]